MGGSAGSNAHVEYLRGVFMPEPEISAAADEIESLRASVTIFEAALRKIQTQLKEAQRWTGSGGECSVFIEDAQDTAAEVLKEADND